MSKITVNHSSWKKYAICPKSYELHINSRIRPTTIGSPLVFGTAVDEALNHLLLGGKDPFAVFKEHFEFEKLDNVEWDNRDLDLELFTPQQLVKLDGESDAYRAWASMRIKGRMMIQAYIDNIYPLIEEVHEVQASLEDRPGTLDAIVTLKGHGKVLLDNKTSTYPYKPDQVLWDTQLASYSSSKGLTKGAFAVMIKNINKNRVKICTKCGHNGSWVRHKTCPQLINGSRCYGKWNETIEPRAETQLIVSDIPKRNQEMIDAVLLETSRLVEQGHFPRNLSACGKIYGKPCPYVNLCWKDDDTGLRVFSDDEGR